MISKECITIEIRRMKQAATHFQSADYATGYRSALSALEGFIATLPLSRAQPAPSDAQLEAV